MKVYVITIDDVYDYEGFTHKPFVLTTMEGAMRKLREYREEVIADLKENENDDWEEDEFTEESTKFSFYPDGYWGTSHWDAKIDEVEVEEV